MEIYKVGLTARSITERLVELTASTSNLGVYEAIGYVVVDNMEEAERRCHDRLAYCRVQGNREFFKETLESIVRIVRECCHPFEVKDCLPATKAEQLPDIRTIVSTRLEKHTDARTNVDQWHSTVSETIREEVGQCLPPLTELKDSLPSDNLKTILYDPDLDFARQIKGNVWSFIKIIDVMFFGTLVKEPIKISISKDSDDFSNFSRCFQKPQEHPNKMFSESYWVFDDDGRWLQISGSIKCIWARPEDTNDGHFLYGRAFQIRVSEISCRGSRDSIAFYKPDSSGTLAYLSTVKDFLRVLALVCADNAKLCPTIDRYFSTSGRYVNLNDGRIAQRPLVEAMTPYLSRPAKKNRR